MYDECDIFLYNKKLSELWYLYKRAIFYRNFILHSSGCLGWATLFYCGTP